MTRMVHDLSAAGWIAGLILVAGTASAQLSAQVGASAGAEAKADTTGEASASSDTEATGDAEAESEATEEAEVAAPPPRAAEDRADPPAAAGASDHESVVGTLAVGYLGRRGMLVPAADVTVGAVLERVEEEAPIIGVRYWVDSLVGIDAGIGLLLSTGSYEPDGGDETDLPGATVFMIHGGVPLSLVSSGHFSFQIVPELNFGMASRKVEAGEDDVEQSAMHFDIGARAGAEVQFGFIDIPQLSLQAGIGLLYAMDKASVKVDGNEDTISSGALRTDVGNNPWNIFTSNISALYYF